MICKSGSVWRKWDLHFHTPSSYDYENKGIANEKIIEVLKESEIAVVAITDHHFIDVKRIHKLRELAKGEITILPGIELRSELGGSTSIHFAGIFSENSDIDTIWTKLQGQLHLTPNDVKVKGNDKVYCDLEKAAKLISELGGIVTIHAGSKSNTIEKITNALPYKEAVKEDIVKSINVYEVGKISDIDGYRTKVFPSIKRVIPMIICSDNHNINKYALKNNCWIKADPTFEGLRQIIYEPSSRICIQETKPREPLYKLEKVVFDFPLGVKIVEEPFCLEGKHEMYFNPHLNCIIGGRGTGKSTILNLISEKLRPGSTVFFKEMMEERKLRIPDSKSIYDCVFVDDDKEEKYIEFLSQNEIETFALDHKKFTDAIYQRLEKLDKNDCLKNLENKVGEEIKQIDEQIDRIFDRATKEKEISDTSKELETNKKLVSSLQTDKYIELSDNLSKYDKDLRCIDVSKQKLDSFVVDLETIVEKHKKSDDVVHNTYGEAYTKEISRASKVLEELKKQDYADIIRHREKLVREIKDTRNDLEKYLEEQGVVREDLTDIAYANSKINELTVNLEELKNIARDLDDKISDFSPEKIDDVKKELENEIKAQLAPISKRLEILGEEVKPISLLYGFHDVDAKTVLLKEFQQIFVSDEKEMPKNDILADYLFKMQPLDVMQKDEFIEAIKNGKEKNFIKTQKYLFDTFSYDRNFEIYKLLIKKVYGDVKRFKVIKVLYDGKSLNDSSFGQRCTAAIVILLILGNTPIMIDEPEAHLDSALISKYLVKLIKEKKQTRQIIFATHNANFVVNGDAELIQCLDMVNKHTTIIDMTIEDLDHREKLWELEGGEEAFKQRGDKYSVE
ncbi:MAG: AAA family ATPase [Candidatus Ancaeobacter aquaticus]|nr:AAA family ATPase [Candidatus Ancaeobacter aquaticus]